MNIRTVAVVAQWAPLFTVLCTGLAPCAPAVAADGPSTGQKLVVVEGDSITRGARVKPNVHARYTDLLAAALPGIRVLNVAKDGESLDVGEPGDVPHTGMAYTWQAQVLALDPDVIVLMSGTNDVRYDFVGDIDARVSLFESHLRAMLDSARAHTNPDGSHPVVLIMSPPPARDPGQIVAPAKRFTASRPRNDMDKLAAHAAVVVADYPEVRWVDIYGLCGWLNLNHGGGSWFVEKMTMDGIHLNPSGHHLIADVLLPFVTDALGGVQTVNGSGAGPMGPATGSSPR